MLQKQSICVVRSIIDDTSYDDLKTQLEKYSDKSSVTYNASDIPDFSTVMANAVVQQGFEFEKQTLWCPAMVVQTEGEGGLSWSHEMVDIDPTSQPPRMLTDPETRRRMVSACEGSATCLVVSLRNFEMLVFIPLVWTDKESRREAYRQAKCLLVAMKDAIQQYDGSSSESPIYAQRIALNEKNPINVPSLRWNMLFHSHTKVLKDLMKDSVAPGQPVAPVAPVVPVAPVAPVVPVVSPEKPEKPEQSEKTVPAVQPEQSVQPLQSGSEEGIPNVQQPRRSREDFSVQKCQRSESCTKNDRHIGRCNGKRDRTPERSATLTEKRHDGCTIQVQKKYKMKDSCRKTLSDLVGVLFEQSADHSVVALIRESFSDKRISLTDDDGNVHHVSFWSACRYLKFRKDYESLLEKIQLIERAPL